MATISEIRAREVLDSRGDPTVEVEVRCDDGSCGQAIVPSGGTFSSREAYELRDGDSQRYDGRGVLLAVKHVNEYIAPALVQLDPTDLMFVDARLAELDDTPRKTRLGANALLGVSLAVAKAGAAVEHEPLYRFLNRWWQSMIPGARGQTMPRIPLPMTSMLWGQPHADGTLGFQDYLVVPIGASSFAMAVEWTVRVFRRLGRLLAEANLDGRLTSDEGGYSPALKSNQNAIELVLRAIEAARLRPGEDMALAIDVAGTRSFDGTHYRPRPNSDERLTSDQVIEQLTGLAQQYPIYSFEDPLADEDWSGWQRLTARIGQQTRIVGDDLFATREDRLRRGVASGAGNAVLIKPNQVGTLVETLGVARLAQNSGFTRILAARSGETEDTSLADLAVGTAAKMIKIGAIQRSERVAKYNRLLRIEEELGTDAINW